MPPPLEHRRQRSPQRGLQSDAGFQQSVYEWFNTSCFAAQPLYTYGDLGRNVLHGPGREELDLAIHREFILKESMRLQFRGEAFNITNTPAFSAPGASFGSSNLWGH